MYEVEMKGLCYCGDGRGTAMDVGFVFGLFPLEECLFRAEFGTRRKVLMDHPRCSRSQGSTSYGSSMRLVSTMPWSEVDAERLLRGGSRVREKNRLRKFRSRNLSSEAVKAVHHALATSRVQDIPAGYVYVECSAKYVHVRSGVEYSALTHAWDHVRSTFQWNEYTAAQARLLNLPLRSLRHGEKYGRHIVMKREVRKTTEHQGYKMEILARQCQPRWHDVDVKMCDLSLSPVSTWIAQAYNGIGKVVGIEGNLLFQNGLDEREKRGVIASITLPRLPQPGEKDCNTEGPGENLPLHERSY